MGEGSWVNSEGRQREARGGAGREEKGREERVERGRGASVGRWEGLAEKGAEKACACHVRNAIFVSSEKF